MLVSPVFKKGDRLDLANYRPISVSDALAKLDAVVLNRLLPWLESHNLRAPTQAGFRPQLGTSHPHRQGGSLPNVVFCLAFVDMIA